MDKIHLYDKILAPMVTEKTTNLSEQNKIVFRVPKAIITLKKGQSIDLTTGI
jgi:large subunit ribosomal protein L23